MKSPHPQPNEAEKLEAILINLMEEVSSDNARLLKGKDSQSELRHNLTEDILRAKAAIQALITAKTEEAVRLMHDYVVAMEITGGVSKDTTEMKRHLHALNQPREEPAGDE